MSATDGAVRALLIEKLKAGYRAPDHVATTVAGMAYLGELADTLIRMHPEPDEFDHVWNEFKREWTRRYWPPFGELPSRLTKLRAKAAENARAADTAHRQTYDQRRAKPEKPYHDGEFVATYGTLLEQADSNDPEEAAWAKRWLAMGDALIKRYDDNDQPRNIQQK